MEKENMLLVWSLTVGVIDDVIIKKNIHLTSLSHSLSPNHGGMSQSTPISGRPQQVSSCVHVLYCSIGIFNHLAAYHYKIVKPYHVLIRTKL